MAGPHDPIQQGEAALRQGDAAAALAQFRLALARSANDVRALIGCGIACGQAGDLEQASRYLERAAALAPQAAVVHANLAKLALEKGDWTAAEQAARRAIALVPDDPVAHDNLIVALKRQGRWEDAQAALDAALAVCPKPGSLFFTLGEFRQRRGDIAGAVEAFRKAPMTVANLGALAGSYNYADLLPPRDVAALHRDLMGRLESAYDKVLPPPPPPREGKLRIGYVSSDLRDHSVAFFIESVLAAHDRDAVEVHCYATASHSDSVTQRLKASAEHWRDCARLPDRALAELIRSDGIDVLIDLGGHTVGNRIAVFAMRAAPVQVTWIGYPNTTGLRSMDFRLTDAISDPPGTEHLYSERLVRLSPGFLCYRPPDEAPEPERTGERRFTFASFNAVPKYSDACIAIWASILARVPDARLILKAGDLANPLAQQRLLDAFASHGIDAARLDLRTQIASRREHLAAYDEVDVALDPLPYNGTTTTCEALWMGVPVVTLAGTAHAGRVGASLLSQAGLHDLIAHTEADYAAMAIALAQPAKVEQRAIWRSGLRAAMLSSPLCQPEPFTRRLEQAYVDMANIRRSEIRSGA
jgi:predicted O-linked N-acetylglucosamine transferase (SPINDLY family)